MLSNITISNLGCFDETSYSVKFKKLNVIVGPNNSGKSTIFKGLNFMRMYCVVGQLQWNTEYYSMQSNYDAVYNHEVSRHIKITVGYESEGHNHQSILGITDNGINSDGWVEDGNGRGSLARKLQNPIISRISYFAPNRSIVPYSTNIGAIHNFQTLSPSGNDVVQFLIEKWTEQDENWGLAQEWIKKIDPQAILLKTPLRGSLASVETQRNDGKSIISINLSLQGNGLQNVLTIIAGIIFSPKGSTIIIEEPENFLHRESIEKLVDLFNTAVNDLEKQIIITTHSWSIIRAYTQDVGKAPRRSPSHVKAKPEDFALFEFNTKLGDEKIKEYPLKDKEYDEVIDHFIGL